MMSNGADSPAVVKVVITGGAGQIGYSLIPMIAKGGMFGPVQAVHIALLDLDIPAVIENMKGIAMEVEDGEFPLVSEFSYHTNANEAFVDADAVVMLGAFPRGPGMERKDLMAKNIGIFKDLGQAIDRAAKKTVKVLVVGNPANTNCLICSHFAPSIPKENFTALTRLDHNRAKGQLALKAGVGVDFVEGVIIWGNHSSTQYPDVRNAVIKDKEGRPTPVLSHPAFTRAWLEGDFISTIQKRGAAVIAARKMSSAMSAARAACEHMRDWWCGTEGAYVSMGVMLSKSAYGVEPGLVYSVPCVCDRGMWRVKEGLQTDSFSSGKMNATKQELQEEKQLAFSLLK